MKFILTFFALFFVLLFVDAAEVGTIKFNQKGALKVPIELIKYNLSLTSGSKFTQAVLNEDIKRLYDTGYFSDVEAVKEITKSGKVNITFNLNNTPRISRIIVKGNKKYSHDKIMENITLHEGEPLDSKLLRESIDNVRKLYHEHGYYNASVYPSTEKRKNGEVNLTVNIAENLRQKINSVTFTGNTVFSSWTLKDTIETSHSYFNWIFDWGLYNKDVIKSDKLRLRNLYWTEGYLDFSVKTEVKELKDDPEYIDIIFKIHEGKPYKVSEVVINGENVLDKKEITSLIQVEKDKIYNIAEEEDSIKSIEAQYSRMGYCDFLCKTHLDTDYKTHTVDVIFNLKEGRPYTVRDVNIKGNKITKDYVIRRELPVEPGDPVDKIMIDAGKSRLMAMNYFKKVKTYTTNSNIPGEKNVNYEVEEKGTAHASIGGGYSTNNSLVGRLTLSESNFDLFDPSTFFRGGGQRLDFLAQVGLERMDFALSFTEPWLFGIPLRLDTTGFFHTREYEYWKEMHIGFEVGLDKPFGEFNSIGINYALDFVDVHDMSNKYTQAEKDQFEGWSRRGQLTVNLRRDTRDNLIAPTSGYMLSALGELNTVALAASANYYRWELEGSGYWSFLDEFFVLHAGAKAGVVQGIGDEVPIYQRYFLGGQHSIRGFEFRKVSPLNTNGAPLGGQTMFVASAEVVHPIYKWISGAPFVDVGNTWSNAYIPDSAVNVGVGYGLRITLPQFNNTPLRIDVGYPVYKTNSAFSDSIQFYFDLGVDW